MTNTLQQIKDGVASDFGQRDWRTADWNDSISEVMIDQIAIRYAQEQNKELVEMLQMWCMDMEERGKAYGDCYTMTKQLIKSATQI